MAETAGPPREGNESWRKLEKLVELSQQLGLRPRSAQQLDRKDQQRQLLREESGRVEGACIGASQSQGCAF